MGTVEQTWSIFIPNFVVKNESGITVMRIVGPLCRYDICGQIEFKVPISIFFRLFGIIIMYLNASIK